MTLSTIIKGIQPEPFRLLIHGIEGVGKSLFSSQSPDPVFIQTEDGLTQIDVPKFPLSESFDSVVENLQALLNEKHDYQTVVIDSIDWLEKLAAQKALEEFNGKKPDMTLADFDFGRGYAKLIPLFETVINLLNRLRRERKMNVILIGHARLEKVADPTGASYDQYAPRLDKRINNLILEWTDIIGFAALSIRTETQKERFGQTRTVAKVTKTDGNDRILILESSPSVVAKSRYPLPAKLPLNGEKFFALLWETIYGKQQ